LVLPQHQAKDAGIVLRLRIVIAHSPQINGHVSSGAMISLLTAVAPDGSKATLTLFLKNNLKILKCFSRLVRQHPACKRRVQQAPQQML